MVSTNLMEGIGWHEGILRRDSSVFPTYDEGVEKVEEIRADNCVEMGAVQNDGVVCDREGIIHENIAENLDGDISEGVEINGADD